MPTKHSTRLSLLLLAAVTMGFSTVVAAAATPAHRAASLSPDNPFAKPSQLPFELPPFDRIHDADYAPAFKAGMAAQLAEVGAYRAQPRAARLSTTPSSRWSAAANCSTG